ncbi:hypothetical protein [Caulobacter sp.]|uniref:hypothetical protein n=1 Tax=Caulobacter sp. TaxID=78 RepID=UPI003BAD5CA1
MSPEDLETWRRHVGRSEVRRQVLDVETVRRFAAAVDCDLDVERRLPPLAHWAFFLDAARAEDLGPDGHPRRGKGLLPPVSLPRRMFAASAMRFEASMTLGLPAELRLTIAAVQHRAGKSGDLVFVEVDRVLTQDGHACVTERQTLVYRDAGDSTPAIVPIETLPNDGGEMWTPGPADLFRFSAVTFNAHRIHYDLPYARDEEGYPGLVVHGPFTAVKLASLAAREQPLKTFSFRAVAPLFADQPVRLSPGSAPGVYEAIRCDGVVAMSARAET